MGDPGEERLKERKGKKDQKVAEESGAESKAEPILDLAEPILDLAHESLPVERPLPKHRLYRFQSYDLEEDDLLEPMALEDDLPGPIDLEEGGVLEQKTLEDDIDDWDSNL